MMEEARHGPHLLEGIQQRLGEIGPVELLIGVATFQHARTIEGVLRSVEKGVRTHFPEARALIVHSDAGSTDGTDEAAARVEGELPILRLTHHVPAARRATLPAQGVPGAGDAFRTFCLIARTVGVRGALVVGADLRTLPDEWIDRLLRPVWTGELDFVAPLFPRHVLDGALTTLLLYPLTRALYGRALRQMATLEAGLSGELLGRLCDVSAWGHAPATRALPVFLTTSAIALRARLGEAWLTARDAEASGARLDLGSVVSEVVGGAFVLAELYEEEWREGGLPASPPRELGDPAAPSLPGAPPAPAASQDRMVAVFRQGLRDLQPIWEQALSAQTLGDLYALADLGPEEFRFSPELWARVVCEFLLAHRFRVLHRDHLLRALVPLYLGRMGALAREAAGLPAAAQQRLVARQARAFETVRAEVTNRWHS